MAHQVQVENTLPNGVVSVNLPNRLAYPAGSVVTLTDEEFARLAPDIFTNGYLIDLGEIGVAGGAAGLQSAVQFSASTAGSSVLATGTLTAGSVTYKQPQVGPAEKKVIVNLVGASSTGFTITFPVAFTSTPMLQTSAVLSGTWAASTTTLTLSSTIATQTGWVIVQGW